MSYFQAFAKFLMQEVPHVAPDAAIGTKRLSIPYFGAIQQYVFEMYFQNPNGCVPVMYLGADVINDINTKFYYPLAFLACLFKKTHSKLKNAKLLVTIDPSYEAPTNYILHLPDEKVILLEESWNAWSFWFKDETAFGDWVNKCLEEMECSLKR